MVIHLIRHSPFGLVLSGLRENDRRIEFAGLSVKNYRLASFVISGAFAGLAGALGALLENNTNPFSAHWSHSAEPILVSLIGGIQTFTGPMVGSVIFIVFREIIERFTQNWMLWLGIILLVIIMGLRGGVVGGLSQLFKGRQSVKSIRRQIVTAPLLEIRRLHKAFGKVVTANGIDLTLEKGVLTSIIGPNGAGKSTLINILSGSLHVDSGEILFLGKEITDLPIHKRVRLGLCRSFQVVNVFPKLTVFDNIRIPVLAVQKKASVCFDPYRGKKRPNGKWGRSLNV